MQECGGSSLKTTKNDNHGYQIGLGKFRIIAKKVSLSLRQFFPSVHECLKITQKVSFYNIYFRTKSNKFEFSRQRLFYKFKVKSLEN